MFGKKREGFKYGKKIDAFENFLVSNKTDYELRKYDNITSFHFRQYLDNGKQYELVAAFTNDESLCEVFIDNYLFVEKKYTKDVLSEINTINGDCLWGTFYIFEEQVFIKYPIDLNYNFNIEFITSIMLTMDNLAKENYERIAKVVSD